MRKGIRRIQLYGALLIFCFVAGVSCVTDQATFDRLVRQAKNR